MTDRVRKAARKIVENAQEALATCQCGNPHRYVFVCDEHGLRIVIEGDQDLQRGMLPLFATLGLDPDALMEACNEIAGVSEAEGIDILRRAGIRVLQ